MEASTPQQWLPILARRLDFNLPRVRRLRRYTEGDAPMPEMSPSVRAAWQRFQREARTNWAQLITEAVAERIVAQGIQVGGSSSSPAAMQAQRIWRDNRLDFVVREAVRYMLDLKRGFLVTWVGADGKAVITADSPEWFYASCDPLQPWRVRTAMKWWRDLDNEKDFALVWVDGGYQLFSRPHQDVTGDTRRLYDRTAAGVWNPEAEMVHTGAPPPVDVLDNPGGRGEFETHTDLIDRINRGILNRLTTEAMQAFRQRALKAKEGSQGLPETDRNGNDIDWAKVFEPAPGALWDLPPGIDIWESLTTDYRVMLDSSLADIRQLSAVTRTPVTSLVPDSGNQTAEGAAFAKEGLIFKAGERLAVARVASGSMLNRALAVEGTVLDDSQVLEVLFQPPSLVSLSEKYAAAAQARAAGESWGSIARNVLGYSPEQIAQDALDRATEQLQNAALVAAAPPPAPVINTPSDSGVGVGH